MAQKQEQEKPDKEFDALFKYDESRRQQYKFGKGDIQFITPHNYPKEEDYKNKPVQGELILDHVYGYKGNTNNARQNLYYRDGLLIYYNAAVGIVFNPTNRQQQFFSEHSDDITCLCVDPREGSTLVATGQKDPKDQPGQGKDFPKIWIWDYKTMKGVLLIDDVCWGQVSRIQWSLVTGYLYVLCGDKDQTLKAYDIDNLIKHKKVLSKDVELLAASSQNTKKLGFLIRPKPCEEDGIKDEIMIHCVNKLQHVHVSEDPKKKLGRLQAKFRAISVGNLNKKGENAFICASYILSNGKYIVGSSSGTIYICDGPKAINAFKAHKDSIFSLCISNDSKILYTGGSGKDKSIKIFDINEEEKGDLLKETYNSGPIHVDGSDFDFQPREMIIIENKYIYVSSKTNQIIHYDIENRRGHLLIDGHDDQIHGVATHPSKDIFITVGWDQTVKIWNAKAHKCLSTYQFTKGGDPWVWQRKQEEENGEEKKDDAERKIIEDDWNITAVTWSNNGSLVAIGTEKSAIAIFEYATEPKIQLNLVKVFQIPKRNPNNLEIESVSRLRFNKDSSLLAIAHMDGNLYIFGINDNGKKCTKWAPYSSRAAPSHLQWGEDSQIIRIFTRDYEISYLRLDYKNKALKRCNKIPDSDKYKFFGNPLIAGWETKGCLQEGMDGTDINDTALSNDGKIIACGDDHGKVRIHNFPVVLQQPNKVYSGHAEHVQSVEFTGNDNYLISVGGADMSIFQWKYIKQQ